MYETTSCLIMNESETELLWDSMQGQPPAKDLTLASAQVIATHFFSVGVQDLVIITLGGKGVFYFARGSEDHETRAQGHIPSQKVQVVDTTAAGDTFVGALATQIARNGGKTPDDPRSIIEFANRAAAKTVGKAGAMAAIPWLDEVPEV